MKTLKRWICLTLTAALLIGIVPCNVFAAAEETTHALNAEPRLTARVSYGTTPHGSASDYTVDISATTTNTALQSSLISMTASLLSAVIAKFVPLQSEAYAAAASILSTGATAALSTETLYIKTVTKGHKDDSYTYRQTTTYYYSDANYTTSIGEPSVVYEYRY